MTYEHRYSVTVCPDCGANLTENVDIALTISDITLYVPTRLDSHGLLIDTKDGAVEKGFHSGTFCSHCGNSLDEYEID